MAVSRSVERTPVRVPAPAPELRGAPSVAGWRNPTVWVLVAATALVAAGTAAHVTGRWPAWATVAAHAVALYLGFTVLHESAHRLAHRRRVVNDGLGWLTGLVFTVAQPTFRYVHLQHHAKTNQPGEDPDYSAAQGPWWRRPVTLFAPLWAYRVAFYRARRPVSEVRAQLAVEILVVGAVVACAATGHLGDLAVLWAFPALVALGFLAYAFDYLPHRPQDSTERFLDTRAYPSRALNVVLLGQNYHNVHHAWVSVPWFRYQEVFAAVRPDLEAVGARVGRGSHRRPLDPGPVGVG